MAAVIAGNGFPVVVLNHNKPVLYCVPASAYEALMDKLEDQELNEIANSRTDQRSIQVSLDEL